MEFLRYGHIMWHSMASGRGSKGVTSLRCQQRRKVPCTEDHSCHFGRCVMQDDVKLRLHGFSLSKCLKEAVHAECVANRDHNSFE